MDWKDDDAAVLIFCVEDMRDVYWKSILYIMCTDVFYCLYSLQDTIVRWRTYMQGNQFLGILQ